MDDFRIIHFFQLKLIDISHIFELVVSETGWKMQIAILGKGCGLAEGPEGRGGQNRFRKIINTVCIIVSQYHISYCITVSLRFNKLVNI